MIIFVQLPNVKGLLNGIERINLPEYFCISLSERYSLLSCLILIWQVLLRMLKRACSFVNSMSPFGHGSIRSF